MRAALLAAALLAACAAEPPPPPAPSAAMPPPARPAPAPDRFDGRYTGPLVLNPDRSRACPPAPSQESVLTVAEGRGSILIDPTRRLVLLGTLRDDGTLRLSDRIDRTIATDGIFTDNTFLGEHRNGLCGYAVRLRKRD